ncbi:hypothetical protein CYLTODRAFT_446822 [Cylindrobasidium torrendii FP15055 ss-10]|uniref:MYND-type domain-containing protein n=1 Tax=Cylindrobasidium torrendii FP15055 ss-10 TaxID=1314674 RepID=A0A0D7AYY7_9AGAR|nr:hypothetical protein CYLTODRAFT_446822 [Cylindrobasidium torrendii FP15055 ss-10]
MSGSAMLDSMIEDAMADEPESVTHIPHLASHGLSSSAWAAVRPFLRQALDPTRMHHLFSDTAYTTESGVCISARQICAAACAAIETIKIGYEHSTLDYWAEFIPSLITWTISLAGETDMDAHGITKLSDIVATTLHKLLADSACRDLMDCDDCCDEFICSIFDFWTRADIVDGPWLGAICSLVLPPMIEDGPDLQSVAHDSLAESAIENVSLHVDALAYQQMRLFRHRRFCSDAWVPVRLMTQLCRAPEFRMALEARGALPFLCKLLRRHSVKFGSVELDQSEAPEFIELGSHILRVMVKMLSGPRPSREALHCGVLLTVLLFWSRTEEAFAVREDLQTQPEQCRNAILGRAPIILFGLASYLWFPSMHRTFQRSKEEVDTFLEGGYEMNENPLEFYKRMLGHYDFYCHQAQSIVRFCSSSTCPLSVEECISRGDEDAVKYCGGCKTVAYCSVACQAEHWTREHRLECYNFAYAIRLNSPTAPLSYRDRLSLVQIARDVLVEEDPEQTNRRFVVISLGSPLRVVASSGMAESAQKIIDDGTAWFGLSRVKGVFEKVSRLLEMGNESVIIFVGKTPYNAVLDVVGSQDVLEGQSAPELRAWLEG